MTSAASDGTGGPSGSVPLGQILVGRGLLSEEQLQAALEEGQRTGEQIGSAIIRLGLLPASTIAQALATQQGRTLKTEYGFAVGFAVDTPAAGGNPIDSPPSKTAAPPAGTSAHTPALLPQLPAPPRTAQAGPVIRQAAPDSDAQRLQAEVADRASKLDAARSQVEAETSKRARFNDALGTAAARIESLEAARAAGAAKVATLERQLAESTSAVEGVEQITTCWDAERRALEETLAAERDLVATMKAEHQTLSGERDELLSRVTEQASAEETTAALTRELDALRDESSARVTGLEAQLEKAAAAASAAASELQASSAEACELKLELASARTQAQTALAESERLGRERADLADRVSELEVARDMARTTAAVLQQQFEEANTAAAGVADLGGSELKHALADARKQLASTQARTENLASERANLLDRNIDLEIGAADSSPLEEALTAEREPAERLARENAALERASEGRETRITTAEKQPTATPAAPAREQEISSHLLFVAASDSYQLIEREGLPPLPGTEVELLINGKKRSRHIVTKVAAAPLPGKPIPCAYLVTS